MKLCKVVVHTCFLSYFMLLFCYVTIPDFLDRFGKFRIVNSCEKFTVSVYFPTTTELIRDIFRFNIWHVSHRLSIKTSFIVACRSFSFFVYLKLFNQLYAFYFINLKQVNPCILYSRDVVHNQQRLLKNEFSLTLGMELSMSSRLLTSSRHGILFLAF